MADVLRERLPSRILTEAERAGDAAGYVSHTLYTEDAFSIMAWSGCRVRRRRSMTTSPGARSGSCRAPSTRRSTASTATTWIGRSANQVGHVSGFAPPGDIHRVRNTGEETAISLHVYGTDVTRIGSSVRRYYD